MAISGLAWFAGAVWLFSCGTVLGQEIDSKLWGTNGTITAIVRSGNTIYVGGAFTRVGPNTGGGVPLSVSTARQIDPFPQVAGVVNCVIADGADGWFIGGSFVAVGGLERINAAHILPGGRVAAWTPNPNGEILTLARSGQTLYLGGHFTEVAGQPRAHIAAIDMTTGAAKEWTADADAPVRTLCLHRGVLYVGGDFLNIRGYARHGIAALDLGSGQPTDWSFTIEGSVRALVATGDTLYIGGLFGNPRTPARTLAAVDLATGLLIPWSPTVTGPDDMYYGDPYVATLAIGRGRLYVGGHFTSIGGLVRGGLAEVDIRTGLVTDWNPDPGPWTGPWNRDVLDFAVADTTLYVAGYFESIGGQPRNFVAEVGFTSAKATSWDPDANDGVRAVAATNGSVFIGGTFTGVGPEWQYRHCLAAFDATTGAVKDWNPGSNAWIVNALSVIQGRLFVGGFFTFIGGQARYGLAALDTLTGLATAWDPQANSVVGSLLPVGDTLYVGGYFTEMSGQPRRRLASFNLMSGSLTDWNPDADSDVHGLAVHGRTIYIGGIFGRIGGLPRRGLAAVDAASGAILGWNPGAGNWANTFAVVGNTVYVGGRFNTIGGQARRNLAALDATTGEATPWVMDANSEISSMVVMGDTLFVAGSYSSLGGQARAYLGGVDISGGGLLPWDPSLDGGTLWITTYDRTLYAGGGFRSVAGTPASHLAGMSFAPLSPPLPEVATLLLGPVSPNPVGQQGVIRFAMPTAGFVDLAIFDVQGRQVSTLLRNASQSPGWHDVPFQPEGWPSGFYICRLRSGGAVVTRKMLVLR